MENQEHYAFLESTLLTDPELTLEEKIEIEAELTEYYHHLAFCESQMANDDLSEDQRETAYQEYAELVGQG